MKTKLMLIVIITLSCATAFAQSMQFNPRSTQPQYGTVTTINPHNNQAYTTPYTITPQRPAPSITYSFDNNGHLTPTLHADPWTVTFGGGSSSSSDD